MLTKEEYNSKINELIEVCNWCKRVKLTCEECVNVYGRCIRNKAILTLAEELTKNGHFDNPPLKFEDLIDLDDETDGYFSVWYMPLRMYLNGCYFENGIVKYWDDKEDDYDCIEFEEDRFYRYEVKEEH